MLRAVLSAGPKIEIRVTTADDPCLLEAVRNGMVDTILMTLPVSVGDLSEEPLWSYEQVVILPPSIGSIEEEQPTPPHLAQHPFILYRRGPVLESWFSEICRTLGFRPHVVIEHDEADSIKELVKLGMGISLLPYWSVADDESAGTLRIVRLRHNRRYNYGFLYRSSGFQSSAFTLLRQVGHRWLDWWPLAAYVEAPLPKR